MSIFGLMVLSGYILYRVKNKFIFLLWSLISMVLASASKQNAVALPAIVWIIEWLLIKEGDIEKSLKKWPLYLTFIIIFFIVFVGGIYINPYSSEQGIGFASGINPFSFITTQFAVILRYLYLVFIPIGQNLDYDFHLYNNFFDYVPFLSFIILLFLIITSIFKSRKNPLFSFGIFWFFILLAPTSSFVPIIDLIFEHRMYLPIIGLMISICSLYKDIKTQNMKKKLYFICYMFICMIILTCKRIPTWENNISLWLDVIKKSPNKDRPYVVLGNTYNNLAMYDEAINSFNKGLTIHPTYDTYFSLGFSYHGKGDLEKAILYYNNALEIKPEFLNAHIGLGVIHTALGKYNKAEEYFNKSIKISPSHYVPYNELGKIYTVKGDFNKAEQHFRKSIELNRRNMEAYNNLNKILSMKNN